MNNILEEILGYIGIALLLSLPLLVVGIIIDKIIF